MFKSPVRISRVADITGCTISEAYIFWYNDIRMFGLVWPRMSSRYYEGARLPAWFIEKFGLRIEKLQGRTADMPKGVNYMITAVRDIGRVEQINRACAYVRAQNR